MTDAHAQEWSDFCTKIEKDLPKSATPVELGTFFYWLMLCYKPNTMAMQIVLDPVMAAYHKDVWEVPHGTTVN